MPDWLQQEVYAATNRRGRIEWIAGAHVPYFGFKVRWREQDPRWVNVREGRMPERDAYDLEQVFPRNCSMEDIAGYVRANYGERAAAQTQADAAQQAERIVDAQRKAHADVKAANIDRVTQSSVDRSLRESSHAKRVRAGAESAHPMVSGGLVK